MKIWAFIDIARYRKSSPIRMWQAMTKKKYREFLADNGEKFPRDWNRIHEAYRGTEEQIEKIIAIRDLGLNPAHYFDKTIDTRIEEILTQMEKICLGG